MSVSNKHLATVLLGAAAAFGAYKYNKMTDEEKQKLANTLKDKFQSLKGEAETAGEKAKEYFADLKNQVTDLFNEHFPDAKQQFEELFETKKEADVATKTIDITPEG